MRLYVSGPITGHHKLNKPEFERVTALLRGSGHQALNPHDVCAINALHECREPCTTSEELLPWADYLQADLVAMLTQCDGLAMLEGWEHSRGALLEHSVAIALGWPVRPWERWLNPLLNP